MFRIKHKLNTDVYFMLNKGAKNELKVYWLWSDKGILFFLNIEKV